jgi:hypothetical protein
MTEEERREIEGGVAGDVAAEHWRVIDRYLRTLEGDGWALGTEPELRMVAEGPEQGRLFWQVADRQFSVTPCVIETMLRDGQPTRRRLIGPEGIIVDDLVTDPPELH